ncbi:hypothetical protein PS15p_208609 [Mucor circinelloides]
MKLPALALVFSAFLGLSRASYLPGFIVQDDNVGSILQDPIKFINCGYPQDILTIDYIALSPNPPVKGEDLQIDFKGYLSEAVLDGTSMDVNVKLGYAQLIKRAYDFCDLIQKVDEKCPIPQGDLTFSKVIALPKKIPPGIFIINIKISTPDYALITCLHTEVSFARD